MLRKGAYSWQLEGWGLGGYVAALTQGVLTQLLDYIAPR